MLNFLLSAAPALEPPNRLFGLDMQMWVSIGISLLNFSALAFVLSWLLYKPVRNFLAKRAEKIAGQLSHAAEEMEKATGLKTLYDQKLRDIDAERGAILDEARKQAADTSRELLAEAKAEADAVRAKAQANVKMEWERAQAEMKQAIIEVSAAMASKFISQVMDDDTRDKLFAETVAELGELSWRN
ncbi:MAG: ATP synthase F0 subunit B [Oscillospiraceae bacterium]|nr:ATP synthase F0 subunit B [Oscillospiraceae bacterium]